MTTGTVDCQPLDFLIMYKRKDEDTINTWTIGLGALQVNYKQMKQDKNVEIVGVYKKLNVDEILDVILSL